MRTALSPIQPKELQTLPMAPEEIQTLEHNANKQSVKRN